MDLYTIWADKEGDISDLDWVNGMKSFFDHLISEGRMESYRITRCKMGFRSIADMPEWMILMEFFDYAKQKEIVLRNELNALELMPLVHSKYILDRNDLDRIKSIRAQLTLLNEMQLAIPPISGTPIIQSK